MGQYFDLAFEWGYGLGEVEFLSQCESPVLFKAYKGTRPAKAAKDPKNPGKDELFQPGIITASVGTSPIDIVIPGSGQEIKGWLNSVRLTISEVGVAWYEDQGKTDKLDVTEDPEGSDVYLLSMDGNYMGRVQMVGMSIDGPK